ncbi:MAG: hypothetical protein RL226_2249 [Bacteroidota bacterium]
MNLHIFTLLFVAMSFLGCSNSKKAVQSDDHKSTIHVDCKQNSVPTNTFSGKVTDLQTNEGLAGTQVVLTHSETGASFGALADLEGNFTINDLPLGDYRLRVQNMSYQKIEMVVEMTEYSACVADIKLSLRIFQLEKPVIYLYPTQKQKIHVELNYAGTLTHTYPHYPENGWNVTADPSGTLWDENNQEYYALFWEGNASDPIIPNCGFIVPGNETASFLEEKLAYLGLSRREANEFIMHWLPRMENNAYNLIHFAGQQYEDQAELIITPQPETTIRIMMITQALEAKMDFPMQDLTTLKKTRKGFTVVEWGGIEMQSVIEKL